MHNHMHKIINLFTVGLWKVHRKVLLPIFHNKVVEEYLVIISKQANILLERLREQSGKDEFDVLHYISACTLDIVFGEDLFSYANITFMNKSYFF